MAFQSDKVMFEIYREEGYSRRYRVVYFTELGEHDKESRINAAMAGEHVYDGFIGGPHISEAKRAIADLLERLNAGEVLGPPEIDSALSAFAPA
jgi:hypothetical protein